MTCCFVQTCELDSAATWGEGFRAWLCVTSWNLWWQQGKRLRSGLLYVTFTDGQYWRSLAVSRLMQLHLVLVGLSPFCSHFSGTNQNIMWCMSHPLQSKQQEPKTVPSATTRQPRHIAIAAKEGKGAALRGTRHPLFAWCSLHLWSRRKPSMI